jgi:hypothetical protein
MGQAHPVYGFLAFRRGKRSLGRGRGKEQRKATGTFYVSTNE